MSAVAESALALPHALAGGTGWADLLRWELRRIARSALFWCVITLIALAFCAGAVSGGALQRAQQAAQQAQIDADAAWMQQVQQRARDYARPAAQPAPYWQDPTDLAGFSRYQLRQHAYKPVLPLAALSTGLGDLAPSRWPVKLETLFGVAPVYDFEPPRGLALGRFDLGHAIVAVLPVALIALTGLLGTFERDRGMLRLIAAQPVAPRAWLSARLLALAAWLLPLLALITTVSLLLGGADLAAGWREWLAALLLVSVYATFWLALAGVVLAGWPGAAAALGVLLSAWLMFSLAVPLLGRLAADGVAPLPSRTHYVDAQRQAEDAIAAERDTLIAQVFRARPELAAHLARIPAIDFATRQSFLVPLLEARLAPWQQRFDAARERREAWSAAAGFVAPPLGLETALATLAGSGAARQRAYEDQVRAYQQQLRDFFWPQVQAQIAAPTPRPAGSYARLNFTDYAAIPTFAATPEPAAARVRAVLPFAAWLALLTGLLAGIAARHLRRWPEDL